MGGAVADGSKPRPGGRQQLSESVLPPASLGGAAMMLNPARRRTRKPRTRVTACVLHLVPFTATRTPQVKGQSESGIAPAIPPSSPVCHITTRAHRRPAVYPTQLNAAVEPYTVIFAHPVSYSPAPTMRARPSRYCAV